MCEGFHIVISAESLHADFTPEKNRITERLKVQKVVESIRKSKADLSFIITV